MGLICLSADEQGKRVTGRDGDKGGGGEGGGSGRTSCPSAKQS